MRNVLVVARREVNAAFLSLLAWIVLTIFLVISGLCFSFVVNKTHAASLEGTVDSISFLFLFATPLLTMRLLSEEYRSGTIETLMTAPVTEFQVVLGKFIGALAFYGFILAPTLAYAVILRILGKPDVGVMFSSYVGLVAMGCEYIALGLFCSTLTQHDLIAAVLALRRTAGFVRPRPDRRLPARRAPVLRRIRRHDAASQRLLDRPHRVPGPVLLLQHDRLLAVPVRPSAGKQALEITRWEKWEEWEGWEGWEGPLAIITPMLPIPPILPIMRSQPLTDAKPPLWQTLTRAGIAVGVLSLFVAWVLYAVFDRVGITSPAFLIPFIAGAALVLGGILINVEWLWSGIRQRKFLAGLNAWIMVGLAVVLLAIANAIVGGTPQTDAWFLDLTQARLHTLSEQTRNILKGLQKEVRITVVIGTGEVQAVYGGSVEVGSMVKELAAQYRAQSRKVQVDILDVYRDKSLADTAFARIGEKTAADSVIVECGGKSVHIPFADLVEAPPGDPFAPPSGPPAFKGEDKLSGAILNVIEEKQTGVYFLAGHGEMGIEGDEEQALNQFVLELKRENCRVAALNLLKTRQMPADCDLLVIAGPVAPFTDSEVEILRQYLEKDGRLFVLVRPRLPPGKLGGLDSLLADYNVDVHDDEIIVEQDRDLMGRPVLSLMVVMDTYGRHPITDDVTQMNYVMVNAAPVRAAMPDASSPYGRLTGPQPDYSVTGLIYSGSNSWAEPNPTKKPLKFDPEHGEKGPLCVGVAVQRRAKKESPAGPPGEPPEKGARLVVLGSCDTASDIAFSHPEAGYEANRTLVMNCVNWLVNKETKLGIPPQRADRRELAAGPTAFKAIFFITVIGMPLTVALIGGLVWWTRRR